MLFCDYLHWLWWVMLPMPCGNSIHASNTKVTEFGFSIGLWLLCWEEQFRHAFRMFHVSHIQSSTVILPFSAPHSSHAAVHTMDVCVHHLCLFIIVSFCIVFGQNKGITRTFYIGIQEENWDYAPGGYNHITGIPVTQDK